MIYIFQGDSVFKVKHGPCDDDLTELGDTSVELVLSDNLEDKFNHLSVGGDLTLSVLAGMVEVKGAASYLTEEKKSARTQRMGLVCRVRTYNEEVVLRHLESQIDPESLETMSATHVLVGIEWGAVCTVTAEYQASSEEEKTELELED